MAKKPWGGRFKKEMDKDMLLFSESLSFDCRLLEADIAGSIAHARMLGECGVIKKAEAKKLIGALAEVHREAFAGKLPLSVELEDIHMNIEARLRQKLGPLAGKLHTGRSRNDQVALDMRLYFRGEVEDCVDLLRDLCRALLARAEEYKAAVMPGFTHTRKAQPVLFSHHLLAYAEMFLRDAGRLEDCKKRLNLCPLGSGALAGAAFPINREMVARELGFDGVTQNSIDAVADRDYLLEFASSSAVIMVHLSRLMEELIWWGLPELGFIELDESFCTGSSMMPNKKNPDAAELIRGKAGRVVGSLMALLTTMKGTPLSYNRDFQEDKPGLFDASDTVKECLAIAAKLIATMKADPERMRKAADSGFVLATDVADYLAEKGLPFRDAHEVAGKMVRQCEEKSLRIEELSLAELKKFSPLFAKDVKGWLTLDAAVARRDIAGGTAKKQVERQLKRLKKLLARR
ncbi:MAG TPA: argininosuccinate lyase [bacterium]|nr:argininosuccinate lyase [bacterium]